MALLHPESDLTLSLVAQGSDILRHLQSSDQKAIVVDELLDKHLRRDGRRTAVSFFATLDLLFTVGAIERRGYRIALLRPTVDGNSMGSEHA